MSRRKGQGNHYTASTGEVIVGLTRRKNGRFYPVGNASISFGSDEALAIHKFRQWEAKQTGPKGVVVHTKDTLVQSQWDLLVAATVVQQERKRIRELILTNPRQASVELDIPQLEWFRQWKQPGPSPTLSDLGQLYQDKSGVSSKWLTETKTYWAEFMDSVQVRTAGELTQQHLTKYHDEIIDRKMSPTYTGHRFGQIKAVFAFARKRGLASTELRTVLDYCAILKPPKKNGVNPQPMEPAVFHKLIGQADQLWKGILYASLNFCMYGSEIASLRWSDISLEKKTLVTDREKTGIVRIAVLWDETVKAIQDLPKKHPEYVFINREGSPYNPHGLRQAFKRLRRKAGLGKEVVFSQIRDGAYSAAVEYSPVVAGKPIPTNAMLLAGHATGISDHYVKRNPRMVADACEAVYKAYMPVPPEPKR